MSECVDIHDHTLQDSLSDMLSVNVRLIQEKQVTRSEARKLIKSNVPTAYSNSVVLLLLKIVDLTYRKDHDEVSRPVETTNTNLKKSAAVGDKQLSRILKQLVLDGVLTDFDRSGHHVGFRLNLEPISRLTPYGNKQKAEKKERDASRSAKARAQRAAQRAHIVRLIERDREERKLASLNMFQLVAEATS